MSLSNLASCQVTKPCAKSPLGADSSVLCVASWIGLERPVAVDAQRQAIQFAIRSDDHIAVIVEAQSHKPDAGNDDFRLGVWRDADNAAMSAPAGGNKEIAVAIKRQPLRTAQ